VASPSKVGTSGRALGKNGFTRSARSESMIQRTMCCGFLGLETTGAGPGIVKASCTFLIPMNYPGTVEVRTYAGHPGRSSVPTHVEMRIVGDERIYAEGAAKVVWMDTQTGKSVPLPDHVRALIEAE